MLFQLSVVLHIIGFIFLVAGLLIGLRVARMSTPSAELLKSIRFGYILSGASLVLITGFYQILYHGFPYYMTQGWFHGKLTVALILVGLSGYLFGKFAEVERSGQPLARSFTAKMHAIIGILVLAAIAFVILGRGGLA